MRNFWNAIKLFCKSPSSIIPWAILLVIENIFLNRLYSSFKEVVNNSGAVGKVEPMYFYQDIQGCCFFVLIFFVFISYEFLRKTKETSMQEILRIYGSAGCKVVLSQLSVLGLMVIVQAVNVGIYFGFGYFLMPDAKLMQDDIIGIFLIDICLLSFSAIAIGYLISKLTNRFLAYGIMLVSLFLIMPNVTDLLLDWQMDLHIPIFAIRDLVFLIPPDWENAPDVLYGMPLEMYRVWGMVFWILLGFMVLGYEGLRKRKKYQRIYCVLMASAVLFSACQVQNKGSVLLMGSHPQSVLCEKKEYAINEDVNEKKAKFTVSDYDMELEMKKELNAKVDMTIQDTARLSEYEFTLFHGYRVSKVVDEEGKELSFQQEGDTVRVKNNGAMAVRKMCFYYSGHSATFYSNNKACFLPGLFPYYPRPGIRQLYKDTKFVDGEDAEANFKVHIVDNESVTSNLKKANGMFEGRAKNVILVNGRYQEKDIASTKCVTLPLDSENEKMTKDLLAGKMKSDINAVYQFLDIKKEYNVSQKKVFCIPGSMAFNSALKPYYEYPDYVLFNGYELQPYDVVMNSNVSKEKEVLKKVFCEMQVMTESQESELTLYKDEVWFQGYEEDYESKIHDLVVEKMKKLGIKKVAREIARYLGDNSNHVKEEDFLQNIK